MKSSIVNIESVSNSSFGTGFVIKTDKKGIYILTCQHVLDDVQIPVIENIPAKVIAKGDFIDMAILYVEKLKLPSLPIQVGDIHSFNVEVIGFSTFNKTLTQKKHINATLYEESIELHSKDNDTFYNVHKIKAKDGFKFDRGNSGSPVICKSSGSVIAMVSNKEGSDLAYAIDIENLKTVWKDMPPKLFHKSKQKLPLTQSKKSSFTKYIITFITIFILGTGIYKFMEIYPSHTISKELQNIYTLYTLPEKDKQAQLEKDRQAQLEKDRQAQLEKDRQAQLEKDRQAELKRARDTELEAIRQAELKRARDTELEAIRQTKLKRARDTELEAIRQAELKRAREIELERAKQIKLLNQLVNITTDTLKRKPKIYKGNVGRLDVVFSINWHKNKKVTGTYFYPSRDKNKLYTLKGNNYQDGKLYLEEYTNQSMTAKIYLQKSVSKNTLLWTGTMQNTNGKSFNIQIQRER